MLAERYLLNACAPKPVRPLYRRGLFATYDESALIFHPADADVKRCPPFVRKSQALEAMGGGGRPGRDVMYPGRPVSRIGVLTMCGCEKPARSVRAVT